MSVNYASLVLKADTRDLKKAERDLKDVRDEGARTERGVTGSMDRMSRSFGAAAKAAAALGAAAAVTAGALMFRGAIREAEQLERNMLRTNAIISATGGTAGRTAKQLHDQARALAATTLASTEGVMKAQQTLLTFRNIRGEVFDDAIEGAMDLASAMGQDLNSATLQLAKALEDPVTGMTALTRSGTVFTEAQKDMVKGMVEANDTAAAQAFILGELAAQYGGVAEKEAAGLAGAQDTLAQKQQEFLIALNDTLALTAAATAANLAMANGVEFLTDHMNDIVGVIGAAAIAATAAYAPAIYGAVTATAAWVASLVTLKGALLATGVGALVVGAGLLIGKFLDLVEKTGGWGAALSALGSLAKGVWQGIQTSAASIRPAINAVWLGVQSDFLSAMSVIVDEWSRLLSKMAGDAAAIPLIGETISKTLSEAAANAASSMSEYDAKAQGAASASARLNEEAKGLVSEGWAQAAEAAVTLRMLMDTNRDSTDDTTDAVETYNSALNENAATTGKAGKAAKAAAKDVKNLADEISRLEDAADPTRKFRREMEQLDTLLENGLSDGAYAQAVRELNEELVESTPILSSVNDAFGQMVDYMFDGFKDGMKGILNIFVNTLKQMAATALKNRITIGLGLGVTGGAGAAAAGVPGGGGISSLFGGGGFLGLGGGAGSLFGGAGLLGMGGGSGFLGLGAGSGLATALGGGAFGAAASVALPILGVGLAVAGLFKKTEVLVAEGVRARIDGASLELDSYEKTKTNNGFGMSSGFDREFERLDDAVQSAVGARLDATIDALGAFGLNTNLDGFSFSKRTEIKDGETFEGESEEVIREALSAAIEYATGGALEAFQKSGEDLSSTLERLVTSFNGVNETLYLFGQNMLPISLDGASAAAALLDLSGGIDAFTQKSGFVFENFLTETEQQSRLAAIGMDRLTATFGDLNRAIPDTHAEFMALLDAQDLTTAAGRNTYAALLDVAQAFVQVNGAAQSTAAAVSSFNYDGEMSNVGSVFTARSRAADSALADAERALRAAFQAEETRVRNAYADQINAAQASANAAKAQAEAASQSAQDRIRLRESIADALERAYNTRRVLDAMGEMSRLNAGTAFLRATVNAGGTSDLLGLEKALDAVADPSTALFGSFAEYQQDFNVNTNLIAALKDLNEGQLSVEMRALNAAENTVDAVSRGASSQVDAITAARDAELAAMSEQMNALLGIDTSVMSVADAIASLKLAQSAATAAQSAMRPRDSGAEFTAGSVAAQINQLFLDELGRAGAQAGIEYYLGDYRDGQSLDDIRRSINNSAEGMRFDATGIPQYEGGGFTGHGSRSGGLDGRGGFMAMLHPNETVIDHTRERGGGNEALIAELRALRDEQRETNARLRYLQDKEKTMARILNDWNTNGQPAERVS